MTLVKLVTVIEDKECSGCGRKIVKGTKVVQQIDQEDLYTEYFHHTKKCCDETFEDYKKITETEVEMDLI